MAIYFKLIKVIPNIEKINQSYKDITFR